VRMASTAGGEQPNNTNGNKQAGKDQETKKESTHQTGSVLDGTQTVAGTSAATGTEKKKDKAEYKQIGNFTVGKTKGKGTFGKVKQGTHTPTGEKVAIKILEKDKIKDHADLDRINREITILKKVRHPNVV